jgi:Clathrin adaptor complex small chain
MPHVLLGSYPQVYLILDEFILGGEIQESSKRVILERLAGETVSGCLFALIAAVHTRVACTALSYLRVCAVEHTV